MLRQQTIENVEQVLNGLKACKTNLEDLFQEAKNENWTGRASVLKNLTAKQAEIIREVESLYS